MPSETEPLSAAEIAELLHRQQHGHELSRVQRWRDIRDFDPATQWSQVLGLLDLAVKHGGPPRTTSGLVEWYRKVLRRSND